MISQYWKNQIPSKSLSMLVKNEDGTNMNLSLYSTITVKMLDSRNNEVDLSGHSLNTNNKSDGQVVFVWPTTRSLFDQTGDYILQLELVGEGVKDYTSTHTIRVRELGGTR